ncbi:MAG: AmmeMemoRadiSam system protein B, partial [Calditrichota bacterium]
YLNEVNRMLDALADTIAEEQKKTLLILSVDLAHMGPKFGDPQRIDSMRADSIRRADKEMFRVMEAYNRDECVQLMQNDLFRRRVDACGAIYSLMTMFPELNGRTLSYGQNLQDDTGSIVSYGCMAFEEG